MKTVAAIYTAPTIVDPVSEVFAEMLPDVRLVNIVDGSLIQDVIAANKVTRALERRLLHYFMACEDVNAQVILNTCSSIGEASQALTRYINLPIVNIDTAMARAAVGDARTIAVLATLPTTLGPTVRLVSRCAEEAKRKVDVLDGLAQGAFDALARGNAEEHDRILMETARNVAGGADAIVLAQGSMARMQDELESETGVKVFSSIRSGVASVGTFLKELHA